MNRHLEFIIEQGHWVNWVSGSLDSRVTGSLGRHGSLMDICRRRRSCNSGQRHVEIRGSTETRVCRVRAGAAVDGVQVRDVRVVRVRDRDAGHLHCRSRQQPLLGQHGAPAGQLDTALHGPGARRQLQGRQVRHDRRQPDLPVRMHQRRLRCQPHRVILLILQLYIR